MAPSPSRIASGKRYFRSLLDSDDVYNDDLTIVTKVVALIVKLPETKRAFKWENTRLNWNEHVTKLLHTKEFDQTYRMSHDAFKNLLEILRPMITVDVVKSCNSMPSSEPIYPELVMHIGVRWLAGGSYADIRDVAGVSTASVVRCRNMFMDAVLESSDLDFKFPQTMEEVTEAAMRFQEKSSNGAMTGCVGCVDGILIPIQQPSGVDNPRAYFSGHYHMMGLNVQAVCDERLRFTYIAVAAPGKSIPVDYSASVFTLYVLNAYRYESTNICIVVSFPLPYTALHPGKSSDLTAYDGINLSKLVERLPLGFYVVGDPAYAPTEHMLTPYSGKHREDECNSMFNFYLSQLRIRIEMAFGQLTTQWRILRSPLTTSLETAGKVVECCARLQNFCITQDHDDTCSAAVEVCTVESLSADDADGLGYMVTETDPGIVAITGKSHLRDIVRQSLSDNGFQRPQYNIVRNKTMPTM